MPSNYKITQENGKVVIEIDTKKDQGRSKSGKSLLIAATPGAVSLKDDLKLNFQLYKPY